MQITAANAQNAERRIVIAKAAIGVIYPLNNPQLGRQRLRRVNPARTIPETNSRPQQRHLRRNPRRRRIRRTRAIQSRRVHIHIGTLQSVKQSQHLRRPALRRKVRRSPPRAVAQSRRPGARRNKKTHRRSMINTRRIMRRLPAPRRRRRQSRPRRNNRINDINSDAVIIDGNNRRDAAPRLKLQSRTKRRANQPANIRDGHGDENGAVNISARVVSRVRRRRRRAAPDQNGGGKTLRHIYAAGKHNLPGAVNRHPHRGGGVGAAATVHMREDMIVRVVIPGNGMVRGIVDLRPRKLRHNPDNKNPNHKHPARGITRGAAHEPPGKSRGAQSKIPVSPFSHKPKKSIPHKPKIRRRNPILPPTTPKSPQFPTNLTKLISLPSAGRQINSLSRAACGAGEGWGGGFPRLKSIIPAPFRHPRASSHLPTGV